MSSRILRDPDDVDGGYAVPYTYQEPDPWVQLSTPRYCTENEINEYGRNGIDYSAYMRGKASHDKFIDRAGEFRKWYFADKGYLQREYPLKQEPNMGLIEGFEEEELLDDKYVPPPSQAELRRRADMNAQKAKTLNPVESFFDKCKSTFAPIMARQRSEIQADPALRDEYERALNRATELPTVSTEVITNPVPLIVQNSAPVAMEGRDVLTFMDRLLLRRIQQKTGSNMYGKINTYTTDTVYVLELAKSSVTQMYHVYAHWCQLTDFHLTSESRHAGYDLNSAKRKFSSLAAKKLDDGYDYFIDEKLTESYFKRHPEFQLLSGGEPIPRRGYSNDQLAVVGMEKPLRHIELDEEV
jgi:hypothetical protein